MWGGYLLVMPKRRNTPSLYELLGEQHTSPRAPRGRRGEERRSSRDEDTPPQAQRVGPSRDEPAIAGDDEERSLGLSAGRAIRVPLGYVFFAAALFIAVSVAGYMTGYWKRDRDYVQAEKQRLAGPQDPSAMIGDPLNEAPLNRGLVTPRSGDGRRDGGGAGTPATAERGLRQPAGTGRDAASGDGGGGGGVATSPNPTVRVYRVHDGESDPRVKGLNYLVVSSWLQLTEAEEAAALLVKRGIAVAILSPDSKGRCTLMALRGFDRQQLRSSELTAYKTRIKQIGQEYQHEHRGPDDFDGVFPKKYN